MPINTNLSSSQRAFVTFQNGDDLLQNLISNGLRKHATGLFILAPSGTGKSYFVDRQEEKNWIDGDELWPLTGADYTHSEWNNDFEEVMEINARSDVITLQAKNKGLWIIGSSNLFLKPDAVVLPPWKTHRRYVRSRESVLYGDGATTDDFEGLKLHRKWIRKWKKYGVPCFLSVSEAVEYCEMLPQTNNELVGRI